MLTAMPKPVGQSNAQSSNAEALRRAKQQLDDVDLSKATLPPGDQVGQADVDLNTADLNTTVFEQGGRSTSTALGQDAEAPKPVGNSVAPGAANVLQQRLSNLQLARSDKASVYTGPPITRSQALDDVLAEAAALGVEIRTGQEANDYLNFAAKMTGMPPEAMQAATLGADLVFLRDEVKDDPRVIREEVIHTQQQAAGVSVDLASTANAEVEARELMIANQARWGITDDEVAEMKNDIKLITERGRY